MKCMSEQIEKQKITIRKVSKMGKILVIDDDKMNLKMATFILGKGGHEAVCASSGQEGLEKIKTEQFDYILLDIEMPEMNGYETLEAIRKDEAIKSTKVIFLTATVNSEVEEMAQKLGVEEIVQKPFKAPELLKVLG